MKEILIAITVLLSACSVQVRPDAATEKTLQEVKAGLDQHSQVLQAIATYVNEMQAKGVLPKPETKAE